uniref:WW domain-containing protein n=1 Tax=Caenorhabditis japonica TaxID=281687 RepID=A0A8R1DW60_CAEJA
MQDGSKSQEQLLMEREEILRQLAEMGDDGEDISDSDEEEGEEECINMSDGEVQVKKEEHDSIETSPVENTLIPPESPPNSVKSELKVENENENENENEEEEKSTAKGDSEPPVPVKKIVLERIDHDKTIPLPDGWSFITHESGMIVYFHKQTRVVTHSRPYQVECPVRDHKVPVFAIPCLYRSIIDEEKNNADSQNAVDSLESVEQADTPCEKIPPANKEIPYCWMN